MKRQPSSSGGRAATGMRRAQSVGDATRQQREAVSSHQNATWDSRGPQVLSSEMLFESSNRRGSNGVIPGQQLPDFPPPSLRPHAEGPNAPKEDEPFNYSQSRSHRGIGGRRRNRSRIYDDPAVVAGYNSVPLIQLDQLPRGGVSIETQSVGRIQVSHQ